MLDLIAFQLEHGRRNFLMAAEEELHAEVGVPSRSDLTSYAAIEAEIGQRIAAINARYAVPGGSPVVSYYTTPLGAFRSSRTRPLPIGP